MTVRGDKLGLSVLVRNLADNAVRYSPPGSRVELPVFPNPGVPMLQLDDAGPDLSSVERARVFERFCRPAAGVEGGTGLGPAIVKSAADRHSAAVSRGSTPLGELRISMCFG